MTNTDFSTPGPVVTPPFGCIAARVLGDGRILALIPLWGDRARITLGPDWIGIETGY
jgi:hypothetical protein